MRTLQAPRDLNSNDERRLRATGGRGKEAKEAFGSTRQAPAERGHSMNCRGHFAQTLLRRQIMTFGSKPRRGVGMVRRVIRSDRALQPCGLHEHSEGERQDS